MFRTNKSKSRIVGIRMSYIGGRISKKSRKLLMMKDGIRKKWSLVVVLFLTALS